MARGGRGVVQEHRARARPAARWWRRWPEWSAYAAGAWSLAYGAAGVYWAFGGAGFPFGLAHDRAAHLSVLARVKPTVAAPVIAVLGLLGAAAAVAMARARGRGARRLALLAVAWAVAVGLTLVLPDFRILVIVAYAPILLLGAPFGWPGGVRVRDAVPWPVVNQLLCVVGGLLWALAATAYRRRTRGACAYCGRSGADAGWTAPGAAARWGRWAAAVAVAVPVVYALTRWAWALGFPLGISEAFYHEGAAVGLWRVGAALATLAAGGALLTLGLTRRWGEVFPRRLPIIGGAAVPRGLVIVPAALVSVLVTAAGVMFVRMGFAGTFRIGRHTISFDENVGALAPELLWPLWGAALAAATLAYHYRTRGRCARCGRG